MLKTNYVNRNIMEEDEMESLRVKAYEYADLNNLPDWYEQAIYDQSLSEARVYKLSKVILPKTMSEDVVELIKQITYEISNDVKMANLINMVKNGSMVETKEGVVTFIGKTVKELDSIALINIMKEYVDLKEETLKF